MKFKYFLALILSMATLVASAGAPAYDFTAANEDGIAIYYAITSETDLTVAVTADNTNYQATAAYTGAVVIPATVVYEGKEYTVTSLGLFAFYKSTVAEVTVPNTVVTLANYAFGHCSALTEAKLPDSLTKIGNFAFYQCSALVAANIPDSVTYIGDGAFEDCSGMGTLTLGEGIEKICRDAFQACNNIQDVWSLSATPPTCEDDAFSSRTLAAATLHVPEGAAEAYRAAEVWKDFVTVVENRPTVTVSLDRTTLSLAVGESVTLVATVSGNEAEGIEFTWTSDNAAVATVDGQGCVTAVSQGVANVTVACGEASASCLVSVAPKCAAPSIRVDENYDIVVHSDTENAEIHTVVTCADAGAYDSANDGHVALTGVYTVSSYASAEGYSDSDVTTVMLVWVKAYGESGVEPIQMGTERAVLLSTAGANIAISGCGLNEEVALYDINGALLYSGKTAEGYYVIPVALAQGNIYLVSIGGRTVKYRL